MPPTEADAEPVPAEQEGAATGPDLVPVARRASFDALMEDREFATVDIAMEEMRAFAQQRGFAVVKSSGNGSRVYVVCDRAGTYRNTHGLEEYERSRQRLSRKCGCPYTLRLTYANGRWHLTTANGHHNHEPSACTFVHPSKRQLNQEQLQFARALVNVGARPTTIVNELERTFDGTVTTRRDIYNIRARAVEETLMGRTPTQALVNRLQAEGVAVAVEMDPLRQLTRVFFSCQ